MHLRTTLPLIVALLLAFEFASQAPAAPAATQPALSPGDAAMLAQLQSPLWRTRQSAQSSLQRRADRGDLDGAEASARATLAAANVPEARVRLRAVLEHITDDRLMQPTLITMHLRDAPAKAVYEELFRQAGAPLVAFHPDLLAKDPTRLTVDAERMPFWEVVSQLDSQSHVQLMAGASSPVDDAPILSVKSDWAKLPRTCSGPFRFMMCSSLEFPNGDSQNASPAGKPFVLTFLCGAEPRRRVIAVGNQITVQEAVDDHSNSLVPDRTMEGMAPPNGSLEALLQHPAKNAGTRLVRFRGTATITVETASRRIEIPDITHSTAQTLDTGTGPVQMTGCLRSAHLISVGFEFANDAPIFDELNNGSLRLVDAKGRNLDYAGATSLPDTIDCNELVEFSADGAVMPVKLVWTHTTATRTLLVPIEFHDANRVNLSSLPGGRICTDEGPDGPLLPTDDIEGQ